jgi:hypothetical protein
MSVPPATIRSVSGDLERLPAGLAAGQGQGPAIVAGELLARVRAELPVVTTLNGGKQVLVAAWLTGLHSARTRRAYAGDLAAWCGWLHERGTGVLAAGRVHVDLWAATLLGDGAAASTVWGVKTVSWALTWPFTLLVRIR